MPVEFSLGCQVYLVGVERHGLSHEAAFAWVVAAVVPVSLAVAWVGAVTVEPWSIRAARWVYATVFEPRPVAR